MNPVYAAGTGQFAITAEKVEGALPEEVHVTSLKKTARIAGLWYLGFLIGPFYLLYVPARTVVHSDAAGTAARVLAHETLFRWGMLTETLGAVIFLGLALALYSLFEAVDRQRARELLALVLVSSALGVVAAVFNAAALLSTPTHATPLACS